MIISKHKHRTKQKALGNIPGQRHQQLMTRICSSENTRQTIGLGRGREITEAAREVRSGYTPEGGGTNWNGNVTALTFLMAALALLVPNSE